MSGYDEYQYSVGLEYLWRDDANNRTRVRLYANVYAGSWYYINYGTDAYLHIDTGGGNLEGNTNWTPWSIARPTQTRLDGNYTWTRVWTSGDMWFNHDANGYASYRIYGNFESWGTYGTPTLWADTGWTTAGLPDYNRSALQASPPSLSRSSDGRTLYMSVGDPGAYNSGPQRDFDWQLHTAGGGWFGIGATGDPNNSYTVDPNTTYYARVLAYNSDSNNGWSGESSPSYGIPTLPGIGTPTKSTTARNRISVPFSAPGYTGSGITSYTINRSGSPGGSFTAYSSPYIDTDTNLIPGNVYSYWVTANTSQFTSGSSGSSASVSAPGAPYAPLSEPTFTVNGLDIEVTSAAVHSIYGNGGVAIDTNNASQGYFVQYQTATTQNGTYGFNGVAGAWSPAVKMENQASRKHKYTSLTPAIFYKFRTYAANSVQFDSNNTTQLYYPHNNPAYTANFATTSTGYFLAAGGRRWTGTEWTPTATAKRWTGSEWTAFTVAKRWDGSQWVNLS